MTERRQMTIQLYPDRHPQLYNRFFDENGKRRKETKPSQEIPHMAEKLLTAEAGDDTVMDILKRIESSISKLKTAGFINDVEEKQLKERATALKRKIPVMR